MRMVLVYNAANKVTLWQACKKRTYTKTNKQTNKNRNEKTMTTTKQQVYCARSS